MAGKKAGIASGKARKRTIVERSFNDRMNDSPTICEPLQSHSHLSKEHEREHAGAREPLISSEAFAVATEIGRIVGYQEPPDWPPGWMGAPARVQVMLDQGWRREIMVAAAREVMAKKRDGPPDSIRYFERPFAKAHAQQSAPLPEVKIDAPKPVYAAAPAANSALAAVRKLREQLGGGQDRDIAFGLPARRLHGPGEVRDPTWNGIAEIPAGSGRMRD